ncbi:endoplasmic reticulum-based factor for assembly of V-ATPase-domain-containing protein [Xylariales sp. PMI_506]|nr:endoplasmic reticulum-based factor for assembly of V-ATPase-domain-containing protein [Xylariales sp. PMI_506]
MVLLTMTASIVEALTILQNDNESAAASASQTANTESSDSSKQPSLEDPAVGNPILHGQVIDLWKAMKAQERHDYSLESLLRGASVYIPPPPPKPEPTEEYKALMARLRREEEQRTYERMLNGTAGPAFTSTRESFARRFPTASMSMADSFAEANRPHRNSDLGDDTIDHGEVQKQVTLIINFLVSIAGCAGAIWMAARWWSTTARLFLTLGGSIIVAIAEVAVYSAYSWRMEEGNKKQKELQEKKQVVRTWVVGEESKTEGQSEPALIIPKGAEESDQNLRRRPAAPT